MSTLINTPTPVKTSNGLTVGDFVVDFRGEQRGTVTAIEVDRGDGRSDKVTVVATDGLTYWNYCTVWSKLSRAESKLMDADLAGLGGFRSSRSPQETSAPPRGAGLPGCTCGADQAPHDRHCAL